MMKKLLLILMAIIVTACSGSFSPVPEADKVIRINSEVAGLTQALIIDRTLIWMERELNAYPDPIIAADREDGKIIGRQQIEYPCSGAGCIAKGDWTVAFEMYVKAADNSVETRFLNIRLLSPPTGSNPGMSSPVWSKRDMDAIRPLLLTLNRELIGFLNSPR